MSVDPAKLQIVLYPDAILRRRARAIDEVTDEVRAVAERMLQLMHEARGVGLAGPQVGLDWRIFVSTSGEEDDSGRVFINPTLRDPIGEIEAREEGCLSIPNVYGDVWRPPQITIDATDLEGQPFTDTSNELAARVWQHEHDHLDGKLIIDRFGQMAKLANRRALKELERAGKKGRQVLVSPPPADVL